MPMFLPFCPRQKSQPTKCKSTINHYRSIYKRGYTGIEIVGQHTVVDELATIICCHVCLLNSFMVIQNTFGACRLQMAAHPNSGRRAKNEGGQGPSQQGSRNVGHATNVQPGTWPTVIKSAHSGIEMPFDLRKLLQVYSRTAALVNICT